MNNQKLEIYLNAETELEKSIDKFIEVFVSYYGESEREYISSKFKSAIYTGYLMDYEYGRILSKMEENYSRELYQKIISNTSLNVTEDILFSHYSLEYKSLLPIDKYLSFYKEFSLGKEGRIKKYYQDNYGYLLNRKVNISYEEFMHMVETKTLPSTLDYLSDKAKEILLSYTDINGNLDRYEKQKQQAVQFLTLIDNSITIDNIEEKIPTMIELNKIITMYQESIEKYSLFKEQNALYYQIVVYNKNLKRELSTKYTKMYFEEIYPLLEDDIRMELSDYLSGKSNSLTNKIRDIFGSNIEFSHDLICYMTSNTLKKIKDDTTKNWIIERDKEKIIEYFNLLGINLGNELSAYLPLMEQNIEKFDRINEIRERCYSEFTRTYYENIKNASGKKMSEGTESFLIKDSNQIANIYVRESTCVSPNIIKKEDNYALASVVIIKFSTSREEELDHMIVHELNHLYELSLIDANSERIDVVSGWDIIEEDYGDEQVIQNVSKEHKIRPYELINEVINEKIAQDISKIMVDNNISVFGKATEKSYKNITSYESMNYIVDELFSNYKEEIIASRKNNNMSIIFDKIGKENFEALNELCKLHHEHFKGMAYYNLIGDLREKKDTEDTRIYYDIVNIRNEIYKDIKLRNEQQDIQQVNTKTK